MVQVSKIDIQQLASQSHFLGTGDPHRVTAVLKQLNSNNITDQSLLRSPYKLYFIIDISICNDSSKPVSVYAKLGTQTVFGLESIVEPSFYDYHTKTYSVNRICDSFETTLNRFNDPSGNHEAVFVPSVSVLYYELTKF